MDETSRYGIIYALIDPRDSSIRYIGQTLRNPRERLNSHIGEAKSNKNKRYSKNWIRGLLSRGLKPDIIVIEDNIPIGELTGRESYWMGWMIDRGARLTNLMIPPNVRATNLVLSQESREVMSLKSRGRLNSRFKDLTGLKFGKLTVKELSHFSRQGAYWSCKCDCGKTAVVSGVYLRFGDTKSCGCKITEEATRNISKWNNERREIVGITKNKLNKIFKMKRLGVSHKEISVAIGLTVYQIDGIVYKNRWRDTCLP